MTKNQPVTYKTCARDGLRYVVIDGQVYVERDQLAQAGAYLSPDTFRHLGEGNGDGYYKDPPMSEQTAEAISGRERRLVIAAKRMLTSLMGFGDGYPLEKITTEQLERSLDDQVSDGDERMLYRNLWHSLRPYQGIL